MTAGIDKTKWLHENIIPDAICSEDDEKAVLGCVLDLGKAAPAAIPFLTPEDFYFKRHAYIYRAIMRLVERDEDVDYMTVRRELKAVNLWKDIGDDMYLSELISSVPTSVHMKSYALTVKDRALRRSMLHGADRLKAIAMNLEISTEKAADLTLSETTDVFNQVRSLTKDNTHSLQDALNELMDEVDEATNTNTSEKGIRSSLRDLDEVLNGYHDGRLYIYGGRPGSGKTALLLCEAVHALKCGHRVVFFTFEMSYIALLERIIAQFGHINTRSLEQRNLTLQEHSRFVSASGELATLLKDGAFTIVDFEKPSIEQVRSKLRELQFTPGFDIVFIDYPSYETMAGLDMFKGNIASHAAHIWSNLKGMASRNEFNVPIIAGAQVTREVEKQQDKRPKDYDIAGSDVATRGAWVIATLYNDAKYNLNTEFPNSREIIICKNRNGPTGTIAVYFDSVLTKFMDGQVRRVDLGTAYDDDPLS